MLNGTSSSASSEITCAIAGGGGPRSPPVGPVAIDALPASTHAPSDAEPQCEEDPQPGRQRAVPRKLAAARAPQRVAQ
eukprot:13547544-Alexandrium_andersonii.AAC.1